VSARDPELEQLLAALRALDLEGVELAFVLGSGLGAFADCLGDARRIPYERIEGMPRSTVPGHAGALVVGELSSARVLVQQGRAHLYEGRSPREVSRAVRAFARLGCRAVVLTNAAGGLVRDWPPGTLMRVRDHINLQGATPLELHELGVGAVYDEELGRALERGAADAGVALASGVYAGLRGPSYETPAEVALLRAIGADAVGMSTVLEALAARAEGARVAAVSLISNAAAGTTGAPLAHEEVVAAGREAAGRFCSLLERATPHLLAAARG
jgi:purine-nucleoside phosphorylase